MSKPLVNRVAQSGIVTIDLESYFPQEEMVIFDIKDYLFHGLILKEKDFRTALKEHDWDQYTNKILLVQCSADAIIPMWSYMLITSYAQACAKDIFQGNKEAYLSHYYRSVLQDLDVTMYAQKRIVIKGCSENPVPPGAYAEAVRLLQPHALSIMFGEPCSTVPVYKRPKSLVKS